MITKTREEAVRHLNRILDGDPKVFTKKGNCHHWGTQELRCFLDYLYDGPPKSKSEELDSPHTLKPATSIFTKD